MRPLMHGVVGLASLVLASWLNGSPALADAAPARSGSLPRRAAPLSPAELADTYARALRYFEPRLSEGDSREVAGYVVDASRRASLDARLLVALLASEGTLARVRAGKEGLRIGHR